MALSIFEIYKKQIKDYNKLQCNEFTIKILKT